MNKKIPISLSVALIWILIKLLLFNLNIANQEKIGVFINIFFVLVVIFLSLHFKVKKEKKLNSYASNFKFSLKSASIYVIVVVAYIFIHHKYVNPAYLQNIHLERMEAEYKKTKNYDAIKSKTPSIQHKTKEEYLADAKNVSKMFTSVGFITSLYFFGLFFWSFMCAIIIPLFYKKVVLRM